MDETNPVRLSKQMRQHIAMWLSAMLVLLSFAASAHESIHKHESINTDCTLCFHQHQLQKSLPSSHFSIAIVRQRFESTDDVVVKTRASHQSYYHSRAPPVLR
ncbi:ABC-type zinc uptake system zinc chaperone [Shewanella donghaensis]|uniref:ABC-type zinc uptake system zinc chaperone n=1 Tax=Shewanella donghaensis TaxID=238836 RepID=UPI001D05B24A|nr:ABC-type zinc uptake system zinc chaperone [Shewanella donghaensis]